MAAVAALIASSSFTKAPIKACASITASSPKVETCCNALAWSNNAVDVLPSDASNFFSASSCLPARSIAFFIPESNIPAPKNAPAAKAAFDAIPPSAVLNPPIFLEAFLAPFSFTLII